MSPPPVTASIYRSSSPELTGPCQVMTLPERGAGDWPSRSGSLVSTSYSVPSSAPSTGGAVGSHLPPRERGGSTGSRRTSRLYIGRKAADSA
jgi:hypothetical protein